MPDKKGRRMRPHAEVYDSEMGGAPAESPGEELAGTAVVSLPSDEYDSLKNELDEARGKAAEYFDGWQRERADFANYKKRIERDQSQLQGNISASVIKKYLVILDDLERALKARPSGGDGAAWAEGIELIYRKLQGILDSEGITPIPAVGETFDPTRHEAIMQEDNRQYASGQIIEVLQQGYQMGGRVIRPAQVKVAR